MIKNYKIRITIEVVVAKQVDVVEKNERLYVATLNVKVEFSLLSM
jgi:hypothetical protein